MHTAKNETVEPVYLRMCRAHFLHCIVLVYSIVASLWGAGHRTVADVMMYLQTELVVVGNQRILF